MKTATRGFLISKTFFKTETEGSLISKTFIKIIIKKNPEPEITIKIKELHSTGNIQALAACKRNLGCGVFP
jgi:hypothetical protein